MNLEELRRRCEAVRAAAAAMRVDSASMLRDAGRMRAADDELRRNNRQWFARQSRRRLLRQDGVQPYAPAGPETEADA